MHPLIPYFERIEIPIGGVINIHGFGILVAVGFITGSWLAARKATRDGLDSDIINRWVTWLIAGVFIGGHLGHALFYEPAEHFAEPRPASHGLPVDRGPPALGAPPMWSDPPVLP